MANGYAIAALHRLILPFPSDNNKKTKRRILPGSAGELRIFVLSGSVVILYE